MRHAATLAEVPEPPRHPERRAGLPEPTIQVSRASEWVAGMQRSIREFARERACPRPLVRMSLQDGEELFLQGMTPGPHDRFVTLTVYEPGGEATRLVIVHLDAIRKVELLDSAPTPRQRDLVFHPRPAGIGFGR